MTRTELMQEARVATGITYVSHSAPKTDGKVEWFIVKPNPLGLMSEVANLRLAGRLVVRIDPLDVPYARVLEAV